MILKAPSKYFWLLCSTIFNWCSYLVQLLYWLICKPSNLRSLSPLAWRRILQTEQCEIKMRFTVIALKIIYFWLKSFKVFTKFVSNFGHFTGTRVNRMKPRSIFCSKRLCFQSKSTHHQFWTNFKQKFTDSKSELDDTLQEVVVEYSLAQDPTVVNGVPH